MATNKQLKAAFHITPEIKPDLAAPNGSDGMYAHIYGYAFNEHTCKVFEAWSESVRNGTGHGERKHGTQGKRDLYSTKTLALQALRHKVAMKTADVLVSIDLMIENELIK